MSTVTVTLDFAQAATQSIPASATPAAYQVSLNVPSGAAAIAAQTVPLTSPPPVVFSGVTEVDGYTAQVQLVDASGNLLGQSIASGSFSAVPAPTTQNVTVPSGLTVSVTA